MADSGAWPQLRPRQGRHRLLTRGETAAVIPRRSGPRTSIPGILSTPSFPCMASGLCPELGSSHLSGPTSVVPLPLAGSKLILVPRSHAGVPVGFLPTEIPRDALFCSWVMFYHSKAQGDLPEKGSGNAQVRTRCIDFFLEPLPLIHCFPQDLLMPSSHFSRLCAGLPSEPWAPGAQRTSLGYMSYPQSHRCGRSYLWWRPRRLVSGFGLTESEGLDRQPAPEPGLSLHSANRVNAS